MLLLLLFSLAALSIPAAAQSDAKQCKFVCSPSLTFGRSLDCKTACLPIALPFRLQTR